MLPPPPPCTSGGDGVTGPDVKNYKVVYYRITLLKNGTKISDSLTSLKVSVSVTGQITNAGVLLTLLWEGGIITFSCS